MFGGFWLDCLLNDHSLDCALDDIVGIWDVKKPKDFPSINY
jgi:hypothetical protein